MFSGGWPDLTRPRESPKLYTLARFRQEGCLWSIRHCNTTVVIVTGVPRGRSRRPSPRRRCRHMSHAHGGSWTGAKEFRVRLVPSALDVPGTTFLAHTARRRRNASLYPAHSANDTIFFYTHTHNITQIIRSCIASNSRKEIDRAVGVGVVRSFVCSSMITIITLSPCHRNRSLPLSRLRHPCHAFRPIRHADEYGPSAGSGGALNRRLLHTVIVIVGGTAAAAVRASDDGNARVVEGRVLWEERRARRSSPVESLGHYAGQQQHRGTRCQMLL